LDALTWHHYYLNGHLATLNDFLDPKVLNYLPKMFETVNFFLSKHEIKKPLWLGETSSAYGGGATGLSDRFVAGYQWLDKLGQSALFNYQIIIRQTFYHGSYALIGEDLYPNPDFWISALYKKLVSNKVIKFVISLDLS
jgi:heparanase 1